MPKLKKNDITSVKPRKKVDKISCAACGDSKNPSEYYASYNPIHQTGRIPYCKICLKNMIADESGNVHLEKVKETLRIMDRPFLYDLWKTSMDDKMDTFGCYIKNIQMPQYRFLGWKESQMLPELQHELDYSFAAEDDFTITKQIISRWGKYEPEEYHKLEQFYWDMKDKNKIETPQEESYLKKLALISMKMDKELESNNYGQAKQLGDLFSKYMADSQFRAIDKTEADKTGGLRTFGQIYAEVESDDFIPPWEYYRKIKGLTQDIVDKTIMHIENFTLRLNKVEMMVKPPSNTPKINEGDS